MSRTTLYGSQVGGACLLPFSLTTIAAQRGVDFALLLDPPAQPSLKETQGQCVLVEQGVKRVIFIQLAARFVILGKFSMVCTNYFTQLFDCEASELNQGLLFAFW